MALCKVTVQGRTIELEARSLYMAILAYEGGVRCLVPAYCGFPLPEKDEMIEVEVNGRVYHSTAAQAWRWANAKADGRLLRR